MKRLRQISIICFAIGILLWFAGPQYAISQIPPEQRARMGDFDWIGVEWIMAGMTFIAVGVVLEVTRFVVVVVRLNPWFLDSLRRH